MNFFSGLRAGDQRPLEALLPIAHVLVSLRRKNVFDGAMGKPTLLFGDVLAPPPSESW